MVEPVVVCGVDFGTVSFSYWIGRLKETEVSDQCAVDILSWKKFSLPDKASMRETAMIDTVIYGEPYFNQVTHWALELQNPTSSAATMPRLAKKISGNTARQGKSVWAYAGNAVTYGLARGLRAAITAIRRARGLPVVDISDVHPRRKFTVFGLVRPEKKYQRKSKIVRFVRFWMHAYPLQYSKWLQWYETLDKRDDAADSAAMGLARLIDVVSKKIDLRKLSKQRRDEARALQQPPTAKRQRIAQ